MKLLVWSLLDGASPKCAWASACCLSEDYRDQVLALPLSPFGRAGACSYWMSCCLEVGGQACVPGANKKAPPDGGAGQVDLGSADLD